MGSADVGGHGSLPCLPRLTARTYGKPVRLSRWLAPPFGPDGGVVLVVRPQQRRPVEWVLWVSTRVVGLAGGEIEAVWSCMVERQQARILVGFIGVVVAHVESDHVGVLVRPLHPPGPVTLV